MSDTSDLTIVIILMGGFVLYVYYIRKTIDAIYDINNIKCNPINLFLKSINEEPSESIDNFAECVQLLGPQDTKINKNTDSTTPASSPAPSSTSASESAANEIAGENPRIPGFTFN